MTSLNRKSVVIAVGMFDSIHFVRWLEHFKSENISFTLFPSSPHRRVHPRLLQLVAESREKGKADFAFFPFLRYFGLPLWVFDRLFRNQIRSSLLLVAIKKISPDFLHALEIQNAGYICFGAIRKLGRERKFKFVVTNYGSDIYWFSRFSAHERRIRDVLSLTDRYAAECERDVRLAQELGFNQKIMPVLPNAGGFSENQLVRDLLPPKERRIILVKGYHGWVGRAHIALKAIESMANELRDFEVVAYSCNASTKRLAAQIAKRTQLRVTAYPKGVLDHDEMIEKFSNALIYIGLSLSDGISTSMLEAMAMGAIPVQTATSCCSEWFRDTGVAIHTLESAEVETGIRAAIQMALTTNSASINRNTIRARASREEIAKHAISFYAL